MGETMNDEAMSGLGRRELLQGGIAALAGLLCGAAAAEPQILSDLRADPRHALADRLSDITLPATDTPGASAAQVAAFVLLALDQRMCGLEPAFLEAVRADLDRRLGAGFVACSRARQAQALDELDAEAFRETSSPAGTARYAWRRIKAAIIAGYYTSEIGASKELGYEPVPGSSDNFVLDDGYRSRSNQGFGGTF